MRCIYSKIDKVQQFCKVTEYQVTHKLQIIYQTEFHHSHSVYKARLFLCNTCRRLLSTV